MSNVIRAFGTWQVTEDGINSTVPYEYNISIPALFESRVEDGTEVWEFPIHLTEKTWLTGPNAHHMDEFNQAFAFAQNYFRSERPANKVNVSDSYTRTVQLQMMRFMER